MITCDRKDLAEVIGLLKTLLPVGYASPPLLHVRLVGEANALALTATDLETHVTCVIGASGELAPTLVPGKALHAALGAKPKKGAESAVSLTRETSTEDVTEWKTCPACAGASGRPVSYSPLVREDCATCGGLRGTYVKISEREVVVVKASVGSRDFEFKPEAEIADWPAQPVVDDAGERPAVTYEPAMFQDALEYALRAYSALDSRAYSGAAWFKDAALMTTDGHRLHVTSGLPAQPMPILMPRSAAAFVLKACKVLHAQVVSVQAFAGATATQAEFVHVNVVSPKIGVNVKIKCLAAEYPDVEGFVAKLPATFTRVDVDPAVLGEALALAAKVWDAGGTPLACLTAGDGAVRVSCEKLTERIVADVRGPEVALWLNPDLLHDAIRDQARCVLRLVREPAADGKPPTSAPIRVDVGDNRFALVMPTGDP